MAQIGPPLGLMSLWRRIGEWLRAVRPVAQAVADVAGPTKVGTVAQAVSSVADAADGIVEAESADAVAARAGAAAGAAANRASHLAGRAE